MNIVFSWIFRYGPVQSVHIPHPETTIVYCIAGQGYEMKGAGNVAGIDSSNNDAACSVIVGRAGGNPLYKIAIHTHSSIEIVRAGSTPPWPENDSNIWIV